VRVVWSPLALDRAAEVADEIAVDHPRAADAWVETILSAVERLTTFPESGRVVPEIRREEIPEVIEGNYRIIYRIDPMQVSVLTIRHSRQLTDCDDLVR
jgi:toxin ParE1/3/4